MIDLLDGQVQYLVTECALPQVLYYNENYAENICDVVKTRLHILEWYKQHDNLNILIERGDKKYSHTGRFQDEEQAREIDKELKKILLCEAIPFTALSPDIAAINAYARAL